jgi:2-amino-4-hydroxy-6-hydroxymethyldihydropteridine diphosphokinase
MKKKFNVIISLGSNSLNSKYYINLAYKFIKAKFEIVKTTKIKITEPFGFREQNRFYNVLIQINTHFFPGKLIKFFSKIEAKLNKGNEKKVFWGERNIDIDIIKFEDLNIYSNVLIIPHQGIRDRKYLQELLSELEESKLIPQNDK